MTENAGKKRGRKSLLIPKPSSIYIVQLRAKLIKDDICVQEMNFNIACGFLIRNQRIASGEKRVLDEILHSLTP